MEQTFKFFLNKNQRTFVNKFLTILGFDFSEHVKKFSACLFEVGYKFNRISCTYAL